MFARQAVPIAPAGGLSAQHASEASHPVLGMPTSIPGVHEGDIVVTDGAAFNGRGFRVCGVVNQRGTLCGRIGVCPFHSNAKKDASDVEKDVASKHSENAVVEQPKSTSGAINNVKDIPNTVIRMDFVPSRSRFKRSWSKEEHSRFLIALHRHGRGKWKEIAKELKTRTANQCQSHAQKYFLRQQKDKAARRKHSIHDMTEPDTVGSPAQPQKPIDDSSISFDKCLSTVDQHLVNARNSESSTSCFVDDPVNPECQSGLSNAVPGSSSANPVRRNLDPVLRKDAELLLPNCLVQPTGACQNASSSFEPRACALLHDNGATTVSEHVYCSSVGNSAMTSLPLTMSSNAAAPFPRESEWTNLTLHPRITPVIHPVPKMNVFVRRNGTAGRGKQMTLPDSMCQDEFLAMASEQLSSEVKFARIFTRSGTEIHSLDELCEDEHLWLTTGDEFSYPED